MQCIEKALTIIALYMMEPWTGLVNGVKLFYIHSIFTQILWLKPHRIINQVLVGLVLEMGVGLTFGIFIDTESKSFTIYNLTTYMM